MEARLNSSTVFLVSRKKEYVDRLSQRLQKRIRRGSRKAFYQGMVTQRDVLLEKEQKISRHLSESMQQKIGWAKNIAVQKILQTLCQHPTAIVNMAIDALSNVACATDVEIRAAHAHEAILKEHSAYIAAQCTSVRTIKVTKDPSIPLGSLLVRANKSIINRNLLGMADAAERILIEQSSTFGKK